MKVFLVEDSSMIRERVRDAVVRTRGAQIIAEAASEQDALAGILAQQPDVVILDLALSAGSGIEVLRRIKAALPEVKVIVLTNKTEPQYRKTCLALGADRFLDKSRDFARLGTELARIFPQNAE